MAETSRTDLVFQGSKFFWRTRNNIDVTIVRHTDLATVEVIAYEPSVDVEAERIYLSLPILNSKLNQDEIEAKFSFAKQNNVAHTEEFEAEVINRAISDFILNHLFIKEYSKEDRKFVVQLQFREDGSDESSRLLCAKPAELVPFETKHYKLFTTAEVSEALKALEDEQCNLEEQCTKAIEMQAQAGVQLSYKERWRIPLVLGKLAKNKVLSDTDSKIWSAVSSNLKTQQDIDTITKVTLRIVTPPRPITPTRSGTRTPNRARSNGPTPNRSPCITPRLTPRSRTGSQRLFNGTISSQNRALSFAEEEAPSTPLPRKLSKRGASSKNGLKAPKHRGSKSRIATSPSATGISSENEDTLDNGIAASGSERTISLMEKVTTGIATGIANLTGSFSAKLRGGSTKASTAIDSETTVACKSGAYAELPIQNGASSEPAIQCASASNETMEYAVPAEQDCPSHPHLIVGGSGGASVQRVKPSKRRSFFGSLLASFTGQSQDDHAGAADPTVEEQPVSLTLSHKLASKKRTSADAGLGSGSGKTEGMSFGAALAAWFPWSHSASVVPVDLTERDSIEQSVTRN